MDGYRWSSYQGYLSYSKRWNGLYKDFIFSKITSKEAGRLRPFVEFMEKDNSDEIERFFSLKNLPSILEPESFITQIKEKFYFKKKTFEVPESKELAPEPEIIIQEVCRYYQATQEDLLITRRGWFNKPRNIAIYLIRSMRTDLLTVIAKRFNINCYSTVSTIVQRVGSLRKKDKNIQKEIDIIIKKLNKSQLKICLFMQLAMAALCKAHKLSESVIKSMLDLIMGEAIAYLALMTGNRSKYKGDGRNFTPQKVEKFTCPSRRILWI
ncbi:MAG: helix-turn-helix domain-containing protein [Thermodesulfobacteriota bacterium]|nr:helix-turn-helix domain-containing protein [Thermodesulfobacteriota bacterium]